MTWVESFVRVNYLTGSGIITYLLALTTLAILINYLFKRQKKTWLIDQIPGPKAYPLVGNALEVNVAPRETFLRIVGLNTIWSKVVKTSCYRFWAGPFPGIAVNTVQAIEIILSSSVHIDKSRDYTFLHPWLGTGLLTSTGKKWHQRRKMLTPAFHFNILDDFTEIFNQQAAKLVSKLRSKSDGKPFDIFPSITLCTLDVILESAMGRNINAQDNSESDYVKAVYRIGALVQQRQTRPWLQPNFLFKLSGLANEQERLLDILHSFSYETIRERRKQYLQSKDNKKDEPNETSGPKKRKKLAFLDLLLEYSEGAANLSDEDIREEVDTFMFEGHDTTAAAINWSLYLLGSHPEIQDRVFEELESIFGDSDRPASSADMREMKLLECCIKEALRLFPSVPFIARELVEEIVIDGYKIPAGTTALIITYRLHRDPVHFPDPEQFIPERFLPENSVNRHPYAYVPFSAGPRNCIGQKFALMEEKAIISTVLRNFRIESTTRREDLKLLGELILRPEDGNMVKLHSRK